jgi:hypothetical protein
VHVFEPRARRLADQAIRALDLRLDRLVVLTEAATGAYALTPVVAALAGADRVYALTRDSGWGPAAAAREATMTLAARWDVAGRFDILESREDPRIGEADIVTNLGFVRPLDERLLARLKPTAVIPLMWETWEFRPADVDLVACRRLGLPVLGTNEAHPEVQTLRYVGLLALKLLFELQVEVFRAGVVVLGSDPFGAAVADGLRTAGAAVTRLNSAPGGAQPSEALRRAVTGCDAIVVAEHRRRDPVIGAGGAVAADALRTWNPGVAVAHIAGGVDRAALAAAGIPCRPDRLAPPGYMSVATDYLGPRPLIDLHTAGLKVGELMARARLDGASAIEAEAIALRNPLAQAFDAAFPTRSPGAAR